VRHARYRWTVAALASTAALALTVGAASAGASTIVGSDLSLAANPGPPAICPSPGPPCTVLQLNSRTGNLYPDQSPIDGVAVSFGVKAGAAETITFRFAKEVSTAGFPATAHATGPTVSLAGPGQFSIPARVPVQTGDELGFDTAADHSSSVSGGCGTGAGSFTYSPALVNGVPQTQGGSIGCEQLVNAVVEPDADHDGFGDETQDRCPGVAGPQDGCLPSTTPPPHKKKCKKKKHRSLSASAAKKKCKKHHK
jgi:hypothetical protein